MANVLVALLSAGSGVVGAIRPGLVLAANEPITAGTHLYARAYTALLVANVLVALLSAGSGVVGAIRPGLVLAANEPITAGTHLYARAYAARAVPLGLLSALVLAVGSRASAWPVLLVAGLAQVGDTAIDVRRRNTGMTIGAGTTAALHLVTAWWLAR